MSGANMIRLEPCTSRCRGQSCCNCCGKAPGMHKCGCEYLPFQQYSRDCCAWCQWEKPEQCMFLQGKTRYEWMEEAVLKESEQEEI